MLGKLNFSFSFFSNSERAKWFTLLFCFVALGFWAALNFEFLKNYSEPSGTDGYFYLKQIQFYSQGHDFYFKDRSFAFYLPIAFNTLLGNELQSYQVAIAFSLTITGLLMILLWNFLLTDSRTLVGFSWRMLSGLSLLAALAFNYSLYELGYGYLKTLCAVNFFLCAVLTFLKSQATAIHRITRWIYYSLTGTLIFLCLITHKTSILFLLLFSLVFVHWTLRKILFGITLALITLSSLAIFYPVGWHYLVYLAAQQFTPPTHYSDWLQWLIHQKNWLATGIIWTLFGFISALFLKTPLHRRLALWTSLLGFIAWNPFLIQSLDAPTYRIALVHWIVAPALLCTLWMIQSQWPWRTLGLCLALMMPIQFKFGPSLHGFFKRYSTMDAEVMNLTQFVKPTDHLTCHHGLEFYVDYKTPIRCRSFLSNDPNQPRWRLAWVPFIKGPWQTVRRILNSETPLRLGRDYFLVPEERWQELSKTYRLKPNWRNPQLQRPSHIYE